MCVFTVVGVIVVTVTAVVFVAVAGSADVVAYVIVAVVDDSNGDHRWVTTSSTLKSATGNLPAHISGRNSG